MSAAALAPGSAGRPNRWAGRKVPLQLVAPPPVAEVTLWDRIGTAPAWLVSLAVHVAVLAALAGITIVLPVDLIPQITSEITTDEIDNFKVETVNLDPTVGNDSAANVLSPSKAASSDDRPPEERMQKEVELTDFAVALPHGGRRGRRAPGRGADRGVRRHRPDRVHRRRRGGDRRADPRDRRPPAGERDHRRLDARRQPVAGGGAGRPGRPDRGGLRAARQHRRRGHGAPPHRRRQLRPRGSTC